MSSNERGFTLVEVLISMVILTVALVSLAEMMAITLRMQQLGRNDTAAARLGQDKLDQLMAAEFDTAASIQIGGSIEADVDNYNDASLDADGDPSGFTRRWRVDAGPDGSADLREVTVRVIPTQFDRRTNTEFEITTIIRR